MIRPARLPGAALLACAVFAACSGSHSGRESARAVRPAPLDSTIAAAKESYAAGELRRAKRLYEDALGLARQEGDRTAEAGILTWLGLASWRLGDYSASRSLGEAALALKLELGLEDDLFRSYNALGLLAWYEARFADAEDFFASARRAAQAAGDSLSLAKVWINQAELAKELGAYERAGDLLARALALSARLGDVRTQGRALNNLGDLQNDVGNPLAAIEVLGRARALGEVAGDRLLELNALGQLGLAYTHTGAIGRAIAYADSALALAGVVGAREEEASSLELLAEIWGVAGSDRRALNVLSRAETIYRELGASLEVGADLRRAAALQATMGNPRLGMPLASEALALHRDLGAPFEELDDLALLAELAAQDGRPSEAYAHLDAGRKVAERIDTRSARVKMALAEARLRDRESDSRGVLRVLEEHATDFAEGADLDEWEAHSLASRAYDRLGKTDSAIVAGRRAVEAVERVRDRFGSERLRAAYVTRRGSAYADLVRVLLRAGHVDEAFEVADAARGRALLEHILAVRNDSEAGGAASELVEGEMKLRQIDRLLDRLEELEGVPESRRPVGQSSQAREVERLSAELEMARAEYEAIVDRARRIDPVGAVLLGGNGANLSRIRAALEPGEVLLEYFVLPERLVLFVVRPDGVYSFAVGIAEPELSSRVRVARELIARSRADPSAPEVALAALHEQLVAPAIEGGALRGAHRLIVVPHGSLTYLPFAALIDGRSRRFLIQEYGVSHLASAAYLPALRSAPGLESRAKSPARLLEGAAFAPFPKALPSTAAEADAFLRAVPAARVFRGEAASEMEFRRALARPNPVHVATHGILNARNPMFSRIELQRSREDGGPARKSWNDGRFEVHELLALPVRSPLVFLSGCETGTGSGFATEFSQGEDYATLGQAFLYAGARNVVATLWRIDDAGAAAFASRFYTQLGEHEPAESLARAQRAMLEDTRYRAPYYWAAFRLSGSGELEPRAQGSSLASVKPEQTVLPSSGVVR